MSVVNVGVFLVQVVVDFVCLSWKCCKCCNASCASEVVVSVFTCFVDCDVLVVVCVIACGL